MSEPTRWIGPLLLSQGCLKHGTQVSGIARLAIGRDQLGARMVQEPLTVSTMAKMFSGGVPGCTL